MHQVNAHEAQEYMSNEFIEMIEFGVIRCLVAMQGRDSKKRKANLNLTC